MYDIRRPLVCRCHPHIGIADVGGNNDDDHHHHYYHHCGNCDGNDDNDHKDINCARARYGIKFATRP